MLISCEIVSLVQTNSHLVFDPVCRRARLAPPRRYMCFLPLGAWTGAERPQQAHDLPAALPTGERREELPNTEERQGDPRSEIFRDMTAC